MKASIYTTRQRRKAPYAGLGFWTTNFGTTSNRNFSGQVGSRQPPLENVVISHIVQSGMSSELNSENDCSRQMEGRIALDRIALGLQKYWQLVNVGHTFFTNRTFNTTTKVAADRQDRCLPKRVHPNPSLSFFSFLASLRSLALHIWPKPLLQP
jgi:hypothetical protein